MSDFFDLMGVGFAEAQAMIGCAVTIGATTVTGQLNPGAVMLTQAQSGESIEIDQAVDVFGSDLISLGISDLEATAAAKTRCLVDGKKCRITGYTSEGTDPTTTLHLKYGH